MSRMLTINLNDVERELKPGDDMGHPKSQAYSAERL